MMTAIPSHHNDDDRYQSTDLHVYYCHSVYLRDFRTHLYYPAESQVLFLTPAAECEVRTGDQQYTLTRDAILYLRAETASAATVSCRSRDASLIVLNFTGTMAAEYLSRAGLHATPLLHLADSLPEVSSSLRTLMGIRYISEANDLLRTSALYQLLAILVKCHMRDTLSAQPPAGSDAEIAVLRLTEYIQQHVSTVSVQELSRTSGFSRTYLYHLFVAYYGLSPSRFILRYRMNLAARLIQSGDYSLKEIAHQVGYQSYAGFSAAFREYFHILPVDAMRAHHV